MIRIGIDARLINQTGVGVYTRNLLRNLEQQIFQFEVYVYLRKEDYKSINFTNKLFVKKLANYHWHSFDEQYYFLQQITKDNLSLMHFTYFSYPILYKRPFVITIHDVIPLTHSTGRASTLSPWLYKLKKFGYRLALSSGVKNSKRIIVPSDTVKNNIVAHFGDKYADKIHTTYEGLNEELIHAKETPYLSEKLPASFFLYVGNFYPHKNVETLIEAFEGLKDENLFLIGPEDYFAKRIHEMVDQRKLTNVQFYHGAKFGDFAYFYKNAKALVHPSLAEGFGLPLIEASYFSCPIIASDIPVFKEILGDNYIAFDPKNPNDIRSKIHHFIEKNKAASMKNFFLPKDHITQYFTFKKMANQTMKIYQIAM